MLLLGGIYVIVVFSPVYWPRANQHPHVNDLIHVKELKEASVGCPKKQNKGKKEKRNYQKQLQI